MYRIFCESYKNFVRTFEDDNYRLKVAKPLELITDINRYKIEQQNKTDSYKKLCDLMNFMEENINRFPKLKAFLWTLNSRDICSEKYNIATKNELEEQTKLVNSFLKLAYWY